MNLVLLQPDDFDEASGAAQLTDRRAHHVRSVLRASAGDRIRVGVVDGRVGSASVVEIDADRVVLQIALDADPPPPSPHVLLLAMPRPKTLKRSLIHASSLGVKRIVLLNCSRVEKSYWTTPLLYPEAIEEALKTGLEQAGDTVLPAVEIERRFKPFVEDRLPTILAARNGFLATPSAETPCPCALASPCVVAVGPDRGFTEYEERRMSEAGLTPVSLGPRTLRVETAVAAVLGRIA